MERKGQTALEYMLMMLVSIILVASVAHFLTSAQSRVGEATGEQVKSLLSMVGGDSGAGAAVAPEETAPPAEKTAISPDEPTAMAAAALNYCGDGAKGGGETCDGGDLGGETCETLGYSGGALACDPDCSGFDVSSCFVVIG